MHLWLIYSCDCGTDESIIHHSFDEHLLEYAVGRVILHPRNLDKSTQMYKNV